MFQYIKLATDVNARNHRDYNKHNTLYPFTKKNFTYSDIRAENHGTKNNTTKCYLGPAKTFIRLELFTS